MNGNPPFPHWPFVFLLTLLAAFNLSGFEGVPFHPDEASQLFMSRDLNVLLTDPLDLAWTPAPDPAPAQVTRLLDAPLTRYLLGSARSLFGLPPLPADWDWSATWEENDMGGALPSERLLWAGRLGVTLLMPLSLAFIYKVGRAAGGQGAGLMAALLLGTHALILLHARRAMAEGALTLGVVFVLWAILRAHERPWLAGLALAVAFNAKQSALALFPVGLLAVVWLPGGESRPWRARALDVLQVGVVFGLVTLALNPIYWRNPAGTAGAVWLARRDLLAEQAADVARLAPEQILSSPLRRVVALLAHLYVAPPAIAEVGDYLEHTAAAEAAYFANPLNRLLRGLAGGGIMLTLTVSGIIFALRDGSRAVPARRRARTLLLLAMLAQAAFLMVAVPLPWQRLYMPLVPFVCVWVAYGLARPFSRLSSRLP